MLQLCPMCSQVEEVGAEDSAEEMAKVVATVEVARKVAAAVEMEMVVGPAEAVAAVMVVAAAAAGTAMVVDWAVEAPLVGEAEAGRAATPPHMRCGRSMWTSHGT